MPKIVAVNEKGRRIGESHPRAKLSDHEIDLLRELIEELIAEGKGHLEAYRIAAEKFEISEHGAKSIHNCRRRAETIARHKRIKEPAI